MTNFCYASLIEISKVSRFIDDFLSDLKSIMIILSKIILFDFKVHLEDPTETLNLN